ncbi:MAG: NADH:flavin oxidoreductase [Deltaproteobacteria bacterium]|nr:NADH:flavin oxidoreductase [Deltaproteobacteria bacterium]NND28836.1 NADH:flavin oxidoreductase [Myxococcales bacterium]MBT8463492.1 NADH:flavin oxidoreductase [Deltaproteobacteria bacterium]MBT8482544.1 NADH:flavin oxidoreductase [Deltaproteobacteria bacterium]NNK07222.1 NADH:flavin oxidoreductase [Myxococcales bacterium]
MADSLDRCFSEATINGLTLRNRLIKAATFEGKSPGGVPSEGLLSFHERIGEGGIGMTTLAYCAAESDGRIHEDMMYMHEGIRPELQRFIRTVQATGAKVSGQLGHCGAFTKNEEFSGARPLGPSKGLNALGVTHGLSRIAEMTKAQIRERTQVIGRAAAFMKSVGFDAIEIHFGHGYGISQFISPKTNKRKDEYAGSLENRMRFALEVLSEVRSQVGDDYPLLGKISMTDGVPGGVSYDDSVEIAAMLEEGGVDVIICSGGTSSMNPMLLFRGDSMVPGLIKHEKSRLMKIGIRLAAPFMFKDYPYEEIYFLEQARRIRDRVQCGVCYIGGVCTNDSIRTVMDAGFEFIQLGRALIFDPDFPKHARGRSNYKNGCSHCNQCATLIEAPGGIYCVERPANFS